MQRDHPNDRLLTMDDTPGIMDRQPFKPLASAFFYRHKNSFSQHQSVLKAGMATKR